MKALRLALVATGPMAQAPDWYLHLRAARYLKVAPWELAKAPAFWRHAALAAEAAEVRAQNEAMRH